MRVSLSRIDDCSGANILNGGSAFPGSPLRNSRKAAVTSCKAVATFSICSLCPGHVNPKDRLLDDCTSIGIGTFQAVFHPIFPHKNLVLVQQHQCMICGASLLQTLGPSFFGDRMIDVDEEGVADSFDCIDWAKGIYAAHFRSLKVNANCD